MNKLDYRILENRVEQRIAGLTEKANDKNTCYTEMRCYQFAANELKDLLQTIPRPINETETNWLKKFMQGVKG